MKKIKLTQGYFTIVDDKDYEELSQYKWCASVYEGKNRVDATRRAIRNGKSIIVRMHREILGLLKPEIFVDHINHNALDNRRENLRACTIAENNCNRRKQESSSIYKGVSKRKDCDRWLAQITHNKKTHYLGLFKSEEEAAEVYDTKSEELHKQYGQTNKEVIKIKVKK